MNRKAKTPKAPGFTRSILSANLKALLAHHYKSQPNITRKQRELEKDSGVRFSTLQRICEETTGANLETLEQIASTFDLSVYQLLTPNLDVANPQMIKGALKDEQRLYANFRRAKTPAKAPRKMFVLEDPPPEKQTVR